MTLALDVPDELRGLVERQATIARHLDAARDLANRPPNDLNPPALAEHAKSLAGGHLTVASHGREWIEAQGMGAFAAVARSSAEDPQLIVMRYDPPAATADVTLGLVGKAITFDSGGISLKPQLRMQDMKGDMCGGAAVIEATAAIAELGLPVRVLTVVASTENVQDGNAFKPGDILRASNGKTIEIINTDAEGTARSRRRAALRAIERRDAPGRLRHADRRDVGRARRPLRRLVRNDEAWAAQIDAAAATSGDLAWRFPLHPRYRRYVDSDFADMKNGSELREGGAVLAAEFLREFAGEGPWAHFDIAGPAFIQRRGPTTRSTRAGPATACG